MTFLLDGGSENFDMLEVPGCTSREHVTHFDPAQHGPHGFSWREAHLRFTRIADGISNMPHLRKFARPVDWTWLSQDTWKQCDLDNVGAVVPRRNCELFGMMRYLLAKHAELSLASPLFVHARGDGDGDGHDGHDGQPHNPRPIRLYLHLKNFAPAEPPHRSNLSLIGEQSGEQCLSKLECWECELIWTWCDFRAKDFTKNGSMWNGKRLTQHIHMKSDEHIY
eukprot:Skav208037  [mRNA]  locus=scaffold2540:91702:93613:+ [translate_table: standard]